ncbi:MAG: hypothetical protein J6W25_04205 [Bacilli bacterium]|nr:hypothetical protein [Bacilli bacterium]MBO7536540.1 hypothetical protein [Bacilli bacterium]
MNNVESAFKDLADFIDRQPKPLILAIEGQCASGKTTLANMFKDMYAVIHIDDFFLPPHLKTEERLAEVGGNINYEAIHKMLTGIKVKHIIEYDKYDCHADKYSHVNIPYNEVIILEGVYSFHPYFNNLIDRLVFIETDSKEQRERIDQRSNAQMFYKLWIPLENRYYKESGILNKTNFRIKKIN